MSERTLHKEITLKHPVDSAAGVRIEKLPVYRLTRGDIKLANQHSQDEFEQEEHLHARMTGLTLEDLALLDLADHVQLVGAFRELQRD